MYRVDVFDGEGGHEKHLCLTEERANIKAMEILAKHPDYKVFLLKEIDNRRGVITNTTFYDIVKMYGEEEK